MVPTNLRAFLEILRRENDIEISAPVDPNLELAETFVTLPLVYTEHPDGGHHNRGVNRHHIADEVPIVIDARMKPGYPDELFPREDSVELVDRRWKEYFAC